MIAEIMEDEGDFPNPQGLPKFHPQHIMTSAELDEQPVACEGLAPIILESWNDASRHCKDYGALLPDGTLMDLGTDEPKAEAKAHHMADCLKSGMLTPSEAWEGGLGAALCDWNT